jgi:hypothetical protein
VTREDFLNIEAEEISPEGVDLFFQREFILLFVFFKKILNSAR